MKKFYYKVDLREPYMGNTLIVGVEVYLDMRTPSYTVVITTAHDGMRQEMKPIYPEEFDKLFND